MGAFRYVLYAAVAMSLSVYAYHAYRRWLAPDRTPADGDGPTATPTTPAPPSRSVSAAPSTTDAAPLPKPPRKRGLGFTDPSALPSDSERDSSESLVQQVIHEEVARKKGLDPDAIGGPAVGTGSAPAAGRSGFFASGDGPAPDRVSVAAALTGVRLPDDLIPLVGDLAAPDPHHVLFISPAGPAGAIGAHLGDELERLGYQVRSDTDAVAIATKGTVTLRVTLHPDAGTERVGDAARYPTAAPNSVVVEFET